MFVVKFAHCQNPNVNGLCYPPNYSDCELVKSDPQGASCISVRFVINPSIIAVRYFQVHKACVLQMYRCRFFEGRSNSFMIRFIMIKHGYLFRPKY